MGIIIASDAAELGSKTEQAGAANPHQWLNPAHGEIEAIG
jgi:hypothetical protein